MRRAALFGFLCLGACKGDDEGTLPADTDGAGDNCGDSTPVIETLTVTNQGMTDPSTDDTCGADAVPLVRITAHATDADGDLHYWTMNTWWDTTVDGAVDRSGDAADVSGTYGQACGVFEVDLGTVLCLTGDPPYATEVEWASVITDDEGHASDVAITTFTTPHADGTP